MDGCNAILSMFIHETLFCIFIDYGKGHSIIIYFQIYYHDICFCLLKFNTRHMLFFTGQKETEQCLPPLVPQVNTLYRTVAFAEKIIQPYAMQDAAY